MYPSSEVFNAPAKGDGRIEAAVGDGMEARAAGAKTPATGLEPAVGLEPAAGMEAPAPGEVLYRFEARLTEINPVGILPEGLRLANRFEGEIVEGPLAGSRIWGIDHFLIRPDGVGVIDAPETISRGDLHVMGYARGYSFLPEGMEAPPPEAMLDPGFEWPDVPFAIKGSVFFRAAHPGLDWLNRAVAVIEGDVNMRTGALNITARAA